MTPRDIVTYDEYMPSRLTPLVNDQIYHVFNRGINHQPTFIDKLEYKRALLVIGYYRFNNLPTKLSKFLTLSNDDRTKIKNSLIKDNDKLVEVLAFCLMPNHFHLLLKQLKENGISKFLSNIQNSYTRYFNTKKDRDGAIFLNQFKAVLIGSDEQLVHVSRYIHLNPYTSYVVKSLEDLKKYPWSSLSEYLTGNSQICNLKIILSFFKKSNTYEKFIEDQSDYQRELHKIQHFILE